MRDEIAPVPRRPKPPLGRHLWEFAVARDVAVLLAVLLFVWLIYSLSEIFLPLLIALVLAHIFNPFVTFLERRRWPRPLTLALLVAVVLLSIAGLASWLGPLLVEQVTGLAQKLPEYLRTLTAKFELNSGDLLKQLEGSLREFQAEPRKILGQVFATTGRAFGLVTMIFSTTTYMVLAVTLVLVYFFFFSWHFNTGVERLKAYVPVRRRQRVFDIVGRMDHAVGQFFRGRLVIAFIMGVILSAGWFVTGVPYWFFLGMVTGLLNIVPYLSFVSWPIALLLKYVETAGQSQDPGLTSILLWPSVVYVAVQLLDNWLLTPWIQSGQTNLNAATVLLVVIIGGALGGVLGMLFAIPAAACLKILLEELVLAPLRRRALAP